jgi:hypothetical protein
MNNRKSSYVVFPVLLTLVWSVYYLAWHRYHPDKPPARIDAPVIYVPMPSPHLPVQPDSPERITLSARIAELLKDRAMNARLDKSMSAKPVVPLDGTDANVSRPENVPGEQTPIQAYYQDSGEPRAYPPWDMTSNESSGPVDKLETWNAREVVRLDAQEDKGTPAPPKPQ